MSLASWRASLFSFLGNNGAAETEKPTDTKPARPVTLADVARQYRRPPSFTDLLPWMEYLPESRTFLLEDGVSVGALFELTPIGVEARTAESLDQLREGLQTVLTDAIPEDDESPWIVQIFVQDEPQLTKYLQRILDYVQPHAKDTPFTRDYLAHYAAHLRHITRPGGLFQDTAVTGERWQGRYRRLCLVLYRRYRSKFPAVPPEQVLNELAARLEAAFASSHVKLRRCTGRDFYEWLLCWFNPRSPLASDDPASLLDIAPYPGDENLPYGADFAERLTLSMPRSDNVTGTWWFDDLPHTVISVQSLRRKPGVGHFTAARRRGDQVYALFDKLPEHTVLAMTIIVQRQDQVRNHLSRIHQASVGDLPEAALAREESAAVMNEMARGDKLFPVVLALYVRGENITDLHHKTNAVQALLAPNGLQPIRDEADLLKLDSYLRNLPMTYDASLDRSTRRSRLMFTSDIAALLPVYGRSRGTGHLGFKFFNRGAEPLVFDPMNREDRKKNGHLLLLGPTGAGKSAQLVDLLMQAMAVYRPRVFIIEAGHSHDLLGQYFETQALSVNQVTLAAGADVSLPPFADALKLLDKHGRRPRIDLETGVETDDDPHTEASSRDLLGEMEIAARIMITGGDEQEVARMTRADRLLLREAIYRAAEAVYEAGRPQVLTQDVVQALKAVSQRQSGEDRLADYRRQRAAEMADGMALFCDGMAGRFFNRSGQHWPDTDVTILDLGLLAREGYQDQLTVAYIGLMNHINDLVERQQHAARPTLVVTDEGHLITTHPLLAPYVVKITKMWRKLGCWFWIATQNLEDFPDQAKRMLNMIEWWLCLTLPKEEIDQITRFKHLTPEQRELLRSAYKEPGKYTEGVVLSDNLETLFRSVPPALSLALAMTEKHEKAERAQIMRERGCTELEAALAMAERIEAQRE